MKKRLSSLILIVSCLVGLAGVATPVMADREGRGHRHGDGGYGSARARGYDRPRRRGRGLDATIERLREETGARILSKERYEDDGRNGYRIRILTPEGRVRRLYIDGESGRLLRRRR